MVGIQSLGDSDIPSLRLRQRPSLSRPCVTAVAAQDGEASENHGAVSERSERSVSESLGNKGTPSPSRDAPAILAWHAVCGESQRAGPCVPRLIGESLECRRRDDVQDSPVVGPRAMLLSLPLPPLSMLFALQVETPNIA